MLGQYIGYRIPKKSSFWNQSHAQNHARREALRTSRKLVRRSILRALTGTSRQVSWTVILLVALCSLSITSAAAQKATLWEIGKNDKSAREFSSGPRAAFVFNADKDNWATAWAAEQNEGVPYTIEFHLHGSASGSYVL